MFLGDNQVVPARKLQKALKKAFKEDAAWRFAVRLRLDPTFRRFWLRARTKQRNCDRAG